MNSYKIICDFGCNLPEHMVEQYQIEIIPTNLHIEGEKTILSNEIDIFEFYKKLREKKMIRTSAINMQSFKNCFVKTLEQRHVPVTLRREMGKNIDAACGQLRAKAERKTDGRVN